MLKEKYTWYSKSTLNNLNKILKDYSLMDQNQIQISNSNNYIYDEDYKQWLVGYSEGQSSFIMNLRDNRCTFDFILYSDDYKVLEKVLYVWNSSNKIHKDKTSYSKIVNSISFGSKDVILKKIIPLFDQYPLLSNKLYHYLLWKEAFLLNNNPSISWEDKYIRLSEIKILLNNNYSPSNQYIKNHINIKWFIGFIEAQGSYIIKTQKDLLMIQIVQDNINRTLLEEIIIFLNYLNPDTQCNMTINNKIPYKIYRDKNNLKIMFSSLDYIYWIFIPNMLKHNMETNKTLSFILWTILIIVKNHGLIQHPLVREYINHIKLHFNKTSGYELVLINYKLPSIENIIEILNLDSIYNKDISHKINAKLNKKSKF